MLLICHAVFGNLDNMSGVVWCLRDPTFSDGTVQFRFVTDGRTVEHTVPLPQHIPC